MTEEENKLNEAQMEFAGLPPELQVNVIITDMLATIDRLIDMRFALNQILADNPELGGLNPEDPAQPNEAEE